MMTEVIEISRESYAVMWFLIGLLSGFLFMPFILWLVKLVKEVVE